MENFLKTITDFIMNFIKTIQDLVARIRESNDKK